MGRALSRATGPLLMTGVVLALGQSGWIALAAVFAAAAVPAIAKKRSAKARADGTQGQAVQSDDGATRRSARPVVVRAGRAYKAPRAIGRANPVLTSIRA